MSCSRCPYRRSRSGQPRRRPAPRPVRSRPQQRLFGLDLAGPSAALAVPGPIRRSRTAGCATGTSPPGRRPRDAHRLAGQHRHRRAAGGEGRHHRRGHLLRVRADALHRDTVVAAQTTTAASAGPESWCPGWRRPGRPAPPAGRGFPAAWPWRRTLPAPPAAPRRRRAGCGPPSGGARTPRRCSRPLQAQLPPGHDEHRLVGGLGPHRVHLPRRSR